MQGSNYSSRVQVWQAQKVTIRFHLMVSYTADISCFLLHRSLIYFRKLCNHTVVRFEETS